MKYSLKRTIYLSSYLVLVANIGFAQSFMPNDTSDLEGFQNIEFQNSDSNELQGAGSITLTATMDSIEYGYEFTNGYMSFKDTLAATFNHFYMEYDYTSNASTPDTGLVQLVFFDTNSDTIGQIEMPIFESETDIYLDITDSSLMTASQVHLIVFASGQKWIKENTELVIGDIALSELSESSARKSSQTIGAIIEDTGMIQESSISLYPNPTDKLINIEIPNLEGVALVEIYTFSGQLVHSFNTNDVKTAIDLSVYEAGIYMVNITTDAVRKAIKVVKQ